ncbi:50S ribosomal protein L24e [Candidatus Woesearchaeota archaeon]|nr:50S ribosomal protein L24e [Candidatus Woesearchaeota archaeon]
MPKCNFCGISVPKGTGKMFVKKDGKIMWFCSNKCEKNTFKLKRKPIDMKWSNYYMSEEKKGKKK